MSPILSPTFKALGSNCLWAALACLTLAGSCFGQAAGPAAAKTPVPKPFNGTVNHRNKMERPSVLIEDGHVSARTLAVIDVPTEQEQGSDYHGSKVIVIPFNGAALGRDLKNASRGAPAPNK